MTKLPVILLCLIATIANAQTPLIIGTIETNWTGYFNKKNPYLIVTHFAKANGEWKVADNPVKAQQKLRVNASLQGKSYGSLTAIYDTTMERMASINNSYRITSGTVPKIGNKTLTYAGWPSEKMYRPIIVTNSKNFQQKDKFIVTRATKADSILLDKYLRTTASSLKLGDLPASDEGGLLRVTSRVHLNKSTRLVKADINLNMYHYSDTVPFAHKYWSRVEKANLDVKNFTPSAWFVVTDDDVRYLDYNITLLDHADYDNDGFDELLFRVQKYNWDGYTLLTDKFRKVLYRSWSFN
jgi:hypothetical protein